MIRPLSIQAKLLGIFLVAAALPLALVSLIGYHNSNKAVEEMVGNRTERIARSVGQELSGKLGERLNDRLLLVNEPVQSFLTAVNNRGLKDQISAYRKLTLYSNSLTKEYDETVLVSLATRDAAGDSIVLSPIGEVTLKGKSQPITIFAIP